MSLVFDWCFHASNPCQTRRRRIASKQFRQSAPERPRNSTSGNRLAMIILGISGLENSVPFKRSRWPGLDGREYRISQGHDSAAALVRDGAIVAAAAEERFSRRKHTGKFPDHAIAYCLKAAGVAPGDVDEIAHSFDYTPYRPMYMADPFTAGQYEAVFSRDSLLARLRQAFPHFPTDRVRAGRSPPRSRRQCLLHIGMGRLRRRRGRRDGRGVWRDRLRRFRQRVGCDPADRRRRLHWRVLFPDDSPPRIRFQFG